ncbi:hypothetical protein NJC40_03980 [Pseudomonas sp. 21LCFQ02]|uniref:hypothetical protein n=1 Tax=unclassified Pseudomonas TaxID=196821 RepID=UPI0004F6076C|nr:MULTISPECIES: hypothetical protein [unclassified Pseudomonas]MCO8160929.1 hypothetical protein [Pseudomonas sp. 21LCFQ010]MCO8166935.1 hypothetical protein [Pseudomonas sp. 21LCFQ02]MCQ9423334.1 hypothetical protein [Pseudomonas sp. LJDD11]BAP44692.1 putative uncharacterized protein [Pseudomonas sp. StFLB209]
MVSLMTLGIDETDFSSATVQATLLAITTRMNRMDSNTPDDSGELAMDYSQLALYADRLTNLLASPSLLKRP